MEVGAELPMELDEPVARGSLFGILAELELCGMCGPVITGVGYAI